jgi:hypothetical protein
MLALNCNRLIQGQAILKELDTQIIEQKINLKKREYDLLLIKIQTQALLVCDPSVDYLIRYDFGLKKKNEKFIFFNEGKDYSQD